MISRVKLFLSSKDVEGAFGGGKWALLKAVEQQGSIQKAALFLRRSYRKAWGDLKRAEQGLDRKLIIKKRGGAQGGASELTDFARQLIRAWELYRESVLKESEWAYQRYLMPLFKPLKTAVQKRKKPSRSVG